MTSLRELRDEHKEVMKRLEEMERVVTELVKGQLIEGIPFIGEMKNFILKAIIPHFNLEEQVLFPILAQGTED